MERAATPAVWILANVELLVWTLHRHISAPQMQESQEACRYELQTWRTKAAGVGSELVMVRIDMCGGTAMDGFRWVAIVEWRKGQSRWS